MATMVPARRGRVVGRNADVEAVQRLMRADGARLVTLTGTPGTGKTTLALEVARGIAESFSDGVQLVDLASIDHTTDIAGVWCSAFHLAQDGTTDPRTQLRSYLEARELLLVLDNCEHVARGTGELVDELLSHCPALCVLATSRSPLGLRDESRYIVDPLATPAAFGTLTKEQVARTPAVALFVERARATDQGFELSNSNARAVASICTWAGGLPLAIELLAPRVATFTPQQLIERLGLPQAGGAAVTGRPARHRTLRAALEWSYELLPERQQRAFRKLGALPGRWTLEAAEEIGVATGEEREAIADDLGVLVEHSLLRVADDGESNRYTSLMPVREYAQELLRTHGELEPVLDAHAHCYCSLIEQISPFESAMELISSGAMVRLEKEHEQLLAAIRWSCRRDDATTALRICRALWIFWRVQGHLRTATDHLELALDVPFPPDPQLRTAALGRASMFARLTGAPERAAAHALEAHRLACASGSSLVQAYAVALQADAALDQGYNARAYELYTEALLLFDEDQAPNAACWGLSSLAVVSEREGRPEEAMGLLQRALDLTERSHAWSWHRGRILSQLGPALRRRADYHRAREHLREAIAMLHSIRGAVEIADCLDELAIVEAAFDRGRRAVQLFGAASALRAASGCQPSHSGESRAYLERLRQELSPREFASAWGAGQELSLDAAVEAALDEPQDEATNTSTASPLAILTSREREVAHLLGRGLSNADIARELVVSEGTARTHVERILRKLGCRSRVQVALLVKEERERVTSAAPSAQDT